MKDYTFIFELITTLVSLVITGFLIPFLRKRLSDEKADELRKWITIAVEAAEQLFGGKTGQKKKEWVVAFLLSKGIVFNVDEVTALIESEVYKLKEKNV